MTASPLPLDHAHALAATPVEALLQLGKAAREGRPLAVMPADLRHDRAHADLEAAREAFDQARGETRVLGPASGGVVRGAGTVGLVTALGPAAALVRETLGPALGQAVDVGLGWDVSPAEVLDTVARLPGLERVLLVLPEPTPPNGPGEVGAGDPDRELGRELWRGLPRALRGLEGCLPIFALATSPGLRSALEALGVGVASTLSELEQLARPSEPAPRGRRVAVVSALDPLAMWIPGALEAAGLMLASPTAETLARLESELPRQAVLGGHVRIPNPTQRHLTTARELLAKDPDVDGVWMVGPYAEPPLTAARVLAAAAVSSAALSEGASPLPPRHEVGEQDRGAALLYARRLMRRDSVGRDEALAILGATSADALPVAPAIAVASLAAARDAARRLGYPILLGPRSVAPSGAHGAGERVEIIRDDEGLVTAWETMLGNLATALQPTSRFGPDPWTTRQVIPVRGELVQLTLHTFPLPRLETSLPEVGSLALPARERELARLGLLAPIAVALDTLLERAPELAAVHLLATAEGQVLDAAMTLVRAERPTR